jgi:hypothetical protein
MSARSQAEVALMTTLLRTAFPCEGKRLPFLSPAARPISGFIRIYVMLRRLIYISNSLIGVDADQLDAILKSSSSWNAEHDVTGVLWAHPESFAQVLEGQPESVELTMDRIRADRRHSDIEGLLDRSVLSRQFGDWSMRLAADDTPTAQATAFMIGFAMGERTASAKRLYDIVLESGGQTGVGKP